MIIFAIAWAYFGTFALAEIEIVQEPKDIRVISGEDIVLPCQITGVPESERDNSVQWLKGTNEAGYFGLGYPPLRRERYRQRQGPTDYALEISNVQLDDDSFFECQVTYHRLRSQKAHLIVLQPPQDVTMVPFGTESSDWPKMVNGEIQMIEGDEARLRCIAASSKPKTDIEWTLAEVTPLNSSVTVSGSQTFTTVSETILKPTKALHGSIIQCKANSIALQKTGEIVKSATLNILSRPEVRVEIVSEVVTVGGDVLARCEGVANPPVERYEWLIGGEKLAHSTIEIKIPAVTKQHNGQLLTCKATNEIGSTTADTLLDIKYAPSSRQEEAKMVANSGEAVDLKCAFDGNPRPTVKWAKMGDDNDVLADSSGTLTFPFVKQEDAGIYQCVATSSMGVARNNVTLVVRGPPIITSNQEQVGDQLACGFISVPAAKSVRITDLEIEDRTQAIVFESFDGPSLANLVQIQAHTGRYECRIENELGVQSAFIVLGQKRISTEVKAGIVVGFVLVLLIAIACLLVKLKYLPPKEVSEQGRHRKTVAVITPSSGGVARTNRHELITEKSVLLGSYASKFGLKAARRASDESSAKSSLINKRENVARPVAPNGSSSNPKDKVLETNSSERSTSGQDDGYGTESGSNHKVSDSSQSESNSDYEVHVSSLISKVNPDGVAESESSKIRVVFDDETTIANYQPQNIRSQTQRQIQYRKQLLNSSRNKARSVSQV